MAEQRPATDVQPQQTNPPAPSEGDSPDSPKPAAEPAAPHAPPRPMRARMRIKAPLPSGAPAYGFVNLYRWHDLALDVTDPLMGWGLAVATDEALIRGQVYDWTIISDAFAPDLTDTWTDGGATHTFYALTGNNVGNQSTVRGTIWVATS